MQKAYGNLGNLLSSQVAIRKQKNNLEEQFNWILLFQVFNLDWEMFLEPQVNI